MIRRVLLSIILLLCCGFAAIAQEAAVEDLLAIDSAFTRGDYEQVELLALRTLQAHPGLGADAVARVNLTTGYALIMLNRETEARRYFGNALDAIPTLTLDPVQVSPKFRVIFDEVKALRPARPYPEVVAQDTAQQPAPKRPAFYERAWLTNLVLPGSGQWMLGHKIRGAVFIAAEAACLTVLIINATELTDSRADYHAEADPIKIRKAYERYNQDYQAVAISSVCAGVIYLAAQADLIQLQSQTTELSAFPTGDGAGLRFSVHW